MEILKWDGTEISYEILIGKKLFKVKNHGTFVILDSLCSVKRVENPIACFIDEIFDLFKMGKWGTHYFFWDESFYVLIKIPNNIITNYLKFSSLEKSLKTKLSNEKKT